ncbi:N-ethylammeline chlorohydrolase [Salipaludibacillus keqinensis]|uniref:5-methylthioadenosine/S-adenosylhomocysteine deaminase n=2 Tax=Salipaludibacillus keqinensis TaxID=2045207 RepID=A0A323TJL7_9BACI|nr:N-ethylammeline chlorohydrolase [Salipaludibacillus keqinensis]
MEESHQIFYGYVIVEKGLFKTVGKGSPSSKEIADADEVIDGQGKWLMPGLVNTHGHLGSTLLRGAGDDMPLMDWLKQIMWPNESRFDKETVTIAAQLAMIEMIKSGTTTFLDMYHLFMEDMAELVIDIGMRATLCRGMIGLCSEEEQEQKLAESVKLYKDFHGESDGKISIALSPHAPYTCPPPFMKRAAEEAKKHNMMIHTHVSETRGEVEQHVKEYGKRPIVHLEELGLFHSPCLIAHGVHVNEEEMVILKENDVAVSHNPISNLKLGSGIAPIPEMVSKGITVGLGTDSTASNNNLDLFEEMRMAALIHKGKQENPSVTNSLKTLEMATFKGAEALRISQLGKIRSKFKADFILVDPAAPHLTPWENNRVHSHLVYAAKGSDVTDVFVGGKALYSNKSLVKLDEEKILYEANNKLENFV